MSRLTNPPIRCTRHEPTHNGADLRSRMLRSEAWGLLVLRIRDLSLTSGSIQPKESPSEDLTRSGPQAIPHRDWAPEARKSEGLRVSSTVQGCGEGSALEVARYPVESEGGGRQL
jgi:hypothetical protein